MNKIKEIFAKVKNFVNAVIHQFKMLTTNAKVIMLFGVVALVFAFIGGANIVLTVYIMAASGALGYIIGMMVYKK